MSCAIFDAFPVHVLFIPPSFLFISFHSLFILVHFISKVFPKKYPANETTWNEVNDKEKESKYSQWSNPEFPTHKIQDKIQSKVVPEYFFRENSNRTKKNS